MAEEGNTDFLDGWNVEEELAKFAPLPDELVQYTHIKYNTVKATLYGYLRECPHKPVIIAFFCHLYACNFKTSDAATL